MDEAVNIITDGYLEDPDILTLLPNQGVGAPKFVHIDYEELEEISETVARLVGPTICLSGPGAFSYERALLFQWLNANKNIYDFAAKVRKTKAKIGKWSWVSNIAKIDDSAVIGAMTIILDDVSIGRESKIGHFCWLDDAVRIGSGAVVRNHVTVHKGANVGRGASILTQTEIRRDVAKFAVIGGFVDTDFFGGVATFVVS